MNVSSIHVTDLTSSPESLCLGGSCIVLAFDNGGGPRSRWQLMMDPYGGTGQWLWTIVASGLDDGSWSWWQLTIDYDYSRTPWYIVASDPDGGSWWWWLLTMDYDYQSIDWPSDYTNKCLLRFSIITDNNPSIHWLSDVMLYTWHLLHFCPSWERDPSHVALSEVSMFFLPC